MKYDIMVFESKEDFEARTNPATAEDYMGAYMAYDQALRAAGVAAGGAALQPPCGATTVRVRDGQRLVQDGPFVEAKEQLGGYFTIDVEDMDAALQWASKCPAASRAGVEVRAHMAVPAQA